MIAHSTADSDLVVTMPPAICPDCVVKIINRHRGIYHTQIAIDAPARQVWEVLTDFDHMDWSPALRGVSGELVDGATITARFLAGGEVVAFEQRLIWQPGHRFGWHGPTSFGDGLHDSLMFSVVPVDDERCLFLHTNEVTVTDPALLDLSDHEAISVVTEVVATSFVGFNTALKHQVEGTTSEPTAPAIAVDVSTDATHLNLVEVLNPHRAVFHTETLIDAPTREVWAAAGDLDHRTVRDASLAVEGQRYGSIGPSPLGSHVYEDHQLLLVPVDEQATLFMQTTDVTNTDQTKTDLTAPAFVDWAQEVVRDRYMAFNAALKDDVEQRHRPRIR